MMRYNIFGQYIKEFFFYSLVLLMMFFTLSCIMLKRKDYSHCSTQEKKFVYRNLNEFVSDSLLRRNIRSCYRQRHKSLDTISSGEKVYLYSWQDRDNTKNEFTIVYDREELGLSVYYLIFDKNDKLIS